MWTLCDGWCDTVCASSLDTRAHFVYVWAADGTDPGTRPPLACPDEMVRLAGVARVHASSHKLLAPLAKLCPGERY